MLALTAGLDRVRDPDSDFERVFVLTSVKQQLRQFETDLETINGDLPDGYDPVSGLTLVGKADVCARTLARTAAGSTANVYERALKGSASAPETSSATVARPRHRTS